MIETVPCDSAVTVHASGRIDHLCPYRDETDHGTITITWTSKGRTFELHSLYEYLGEWSSARLSHEQVTDRIMHDLSTVEGVTDVRVTTAWDTARLRVSVTTGGESDSLLREPDRKEWREHPGND